MIMKFFVNSLSLGGYASTLKEPGPAVYQIELCLTRSALHRV